MLRISQAQYRALSRASWESYADELHRRMLQRAPELARTFDEKSLAEVVRATIVAAKAHGFTHRGPVRLYFDLCLSFGSGFVDDPMFPWAASAIGDRSPATQMDRAYALFTESLAALEEINGTRDEHARTAMRTLDEWARGLHEPLAADEASVVHQMHLLHPQKAAHGGEAALHCLFRDATAACQELDVASPRAIMLITALKFGFGAGCLNDPIYGWIRDTLSDRKNTSMARRFEHLERRALIWLDAVLKHQQPTH